MKKLGLDKRTIQLNEHLNPDARTLDEGIESGINKIVNWVNKNVMKKFWTADQKEAERKMTAGKVGEMYDDLVINNPDIVKLISSNVRQSAIQAAMKKAGYKPHDIEPDGGGNNRLNVTERMYTVIQMLKQHHRENRKKHGSKGDGNFTVVPNRKSRKKVAPK